MYVGRYRHGGQAGADLQLSYDWEAARLDAMAMLMMKSGIQYVSVLSGGYASVLRYLVAADRAAEGCEADDVEGGAEDGGGYDMGLQVLAAVDEEAVRDLSDEGWKGSTSPIGGISRVQALRSSLASLLSTMRSTKGSGDREGYWVSSIASSTESNEMVSQGNEAGHPMDKEGVSVYLSVDPDGEIRVHYVAEEGWTADPSTNSNNTNNEIITMSQLQQLLLDESESTSMPIETSTSASASSSRSASPSPYSMAGYSSIESVLIVGEEEQVEDALVAAREEEQWEVDLISNKEQWEVGYYVKDDL